MFQFTPQVLARLCHLYPPPEYVKQAASQPDVAPASYFDFADPQQRQLPLHTPAAAWASAAALFDCPVAQRPTNYSGLRDALYKAAKLHGIERDLYQLEAAGRSNQPATPEELPDSCFAYIDDSTQPPTRSLMVRHAKEALAAADWLLKYRNEMTLEKCAAIATRIAVRIDELGAAATVAQLHGLEKLAGFGVCPPEIVEDLLESRMLMTQAVRDPNRRSDAQAATKGLESLLLDLRKEAGLRKEGSVGVQVTSHPSRLQEIAKLVDNVDEYFGFRRFYGNPLAPPEEVFGITKYAADDFLRRHVILRHGAAYRKEDLGRIPLSDIQQFMGPQVAEQCTRTGLHVDVEKTASVLAQLPETAAQTFDRLAQTYAVQPVEQGQSTLPRLTLQVLLATADASPGW